MVRPTRGSAVVEQQRAGDSAVLQSALGINISNNIIHDDDNNSLISASAQYNNLMPASVRYDDNDDTGITNTGVIAEPVQDDEAVTYAIRMREPALSNTGTLPTTENTSSRRNSFRAVVLDAEAVIEIPDPVQIERHPNLIAKELNDNIRKYYWQRFAFRLCMMLSMLGLGLGLGLGLPKGSEQEETINSTTNTTFLEMSLSKPPIPTQISRALSVSHDGFLKGILMPISFSGNCSIVATPLLYANEIEWVRTIQYDIESEEWIFLNEELINDMDKLGNRFGAAVDLSHDGSVMVVAMPRDDPNSVPKAGSVRVYSQKQINNNNNNDNQWTPLGSDFHGKESNEWMGTIVSLSSDGSTVAFTSPRGASTRGYAQVHRYNESTNEWTQMGTDIIGEGNTSYLSYVDLNADGSFIVVGAQYDDTSAKNAGSVRVFRFDATGEENWIQVGESINGEESGAQFGTYVHISLDGLTVAFSWFGITKLARVYSYHSEKDIWIQNGNDLFGQCLKLSNDAKQVIMCSSELKSCSTYRFDDEEDDWKVIVTFGPDPSLFTPLSFTDDGKEVCGLASFDVGSNETERTTTISCYQL